jgi:hypothetical protein
MCNVIIVHGIIVHVTVEVVHVEVIRQSRPPDRRLLPLVRKIILNKAKYYVSQNKTK